MIRQTMTSGITLQIISLLCFVSVVSAANMEITPFNSSNQSPLVQIYGLPHDTGADIVPPGKFRLALNQDLTSNYTVHTGKQEQITLDGETYRLALAARYGVAPRWEAGIEVPYLAQGGGFLDNFIIDWHNTFGLPQGGRDIGPKNKINFSYRKDGVRKLLMNRPSSGLGDIVLTSGFSLYDESGSERHDTIALKGGVKLPTGDSSYLRGSGGTDVVLQLCGRSNNVREWGDVAFYGSLGALAMSSGDVLRDQHNPLAGVGTLGIGWAPNGWISFKAQLNGNTALYRESSLTELSESSMMLLFGGALTLPEKYLLDIGVAEDFKVGTAPDVSFHLGLSKMF